MELFDDTVKDMHELFKCDSQNWLFGAGISFAANIPLMSGLTQRVEAVISKKRNGLGPNYQTIANSLQDGYHIEYVLSHIGDLLALVERSRDTYVLFKRRRFTKESLINLYDEIIKQISTTIRYGYVAANAAMSTPERIGSINEPIINIAYHKDFIKALLSSKANLIPRSQLWFFTVNYDTLLEDALALEKIIVNDGFCGAAIGVWDPEASFNNTPGNNTLCMNCVKLHGSVDWLKDPDIGLIRNRYGVNYLENTEHVLIYPQATKYVETQKDPFATLFGKFRERLNSPKENIWICCGYSFGDQHINAEIEAAIKATKNQIRAVIIFIKDINPVLSKWLATGEMGNKIYVATERGIYHGSDKLIEDSAGRKLNWWKFSALTSFLENGEPIYA